APGRGVKHDQGTASDGQRKEPAVRTSDRLRRCGIVLLGMGLLVLARTSAAQEPQKGEAKPPWQRLLQGDDAKQAELLQSRINDLAAADRYVEALAVAKELLALRQRLQGADHWEAVNARHQSRTLEKQAGFNEQQQKDYQCAEAARREAEDLFAKGRYG